MPLLQVSEPATAVHPQGYYHPPTTHPKAMAEAGGEVVRDIDDDDHAGVQALLALAHARHPREDTPTRIRPSPPR